MTKVSITRSKLDDLASAISVKSGAKPRKPRPFMYVCNRQRCKECHPDCHWTADINYALYDTHYDFSPELDGLYERIRR